MEVIINDEKYIIDEGISFKSEKMMNILEEYKNIGIPIKNEYSTTNYKSVKVLSMINNEYDFIKDLSNERIGISTLRKELLKIYPEEKCGNNEYFKIKEYKGNKMYIETKEKIEQTKETIIDEKTNRINDEKSKLGKRFEEIIHMEGNHLVSVDATTGSGKTYSIKKVIKNINKEIKKNIFIFTSPTKSNLKDQKESKKELNELGIPNIRIYARNDFKKEKAWLEITNKLKNILNNIKLNENIYKKIIEDLITDIEYKSLNNIKKLNELDKYENKKDYYELENIISKSNDRIARKVNDVIGDIKFLKNNSNAYKHLLNFEKESKKKYLDSEKITSNTYLDFIEVLGSISSAFDLLYFPFINTIYLYSTFDKLVQGDYVKISSKFNENEKSYGYKYNISKTPLFEFFFDRNINNNNKKDYENTYIFYNSNQINLNIFIDESTESGPKFNKNLQRKRELNMNMPDLIVQYGKMFENTDISFWINLEKHLKKGTDKDFSIIIKNIDEIKINEKEIEFNIQKLSINENLKKEYMKFSYEYIKLLERRGKNHINNLLKHFNLLKNKLNLFDISIDKFFNILKFQQKINMNYLYINNKIYNEKIQYFQQIFFQQDKDLYVSHKKELSKFKINFDKLEIERKENINKSEINLYEYLMSSIIILFLLNDKNIKLYIDTIKNDQREVTDNILVALKETIYNTNSNYGFKLEDVSKNLNKNEEIIEITDDFVYKEDKFLISLKKYDKTKEVRNKLKTEIDFKLYLKEKSPEEILIHSINNFPGNKIKIFKMSATDGNLDYILDWDDNYLKRKLKDKYLLNEEIMNGIIKDINIIRDKEVIYKFFKKPEEISNFTENDYKENFKRLEKEIIEIYSQENLKNNSKKWKIEELKGIVRTIAETVNNNKINASLGATQTILNFKKIIENNLNKKSDGFYFKSLFKHLKQEFKGFNGGVYVLKLGSKNIIKIIIYKNEIEDYISLYNTRYSNQNDKYMENIGDMKNWDEILNTTEIPLLTIGDYSNLAVGLNFTQKYNKETKDFDSLIMISDPYYDITENLLKEPLESFEFKLRTFMKDPNLYNKFNLENLAEMIYDENFKNNRYLQDVWNYIFLIIQFLGRGTRKDNNDYMIIYFNNYTVKKLQQRLLKLENIGIDKSKLEKLSKVTDKIFNIVKEQTHETFQDLKEKNKFLKLQNKKNKDYKEFTKKLLIEIELYKNEDIKNNDIITKWDVLLRDIKLILTDTNKYFKNLKNSKMFSDKEIESLYYISPYNKEDFITDLTQMELYTIKENNLIKYIDIQTRLEKIKNNEIVGNNDDVFNPLSFFRANFLNNGDLKDNNDVYKLVNNLLKNQDNLFNGFLLNPNFLLEIVSAGFLEELFKDIIIEAIKYRTDIKILDKEDIKNYKFLYEQFDLYIVYKNILYCFDCKNWGENGDMNLSSETIDKVKNKIKNLSNKNEWKEVKPYLVNLWSNNSSNIVKNINIFNLFTLYNETDKYGNTIQKIQVNEINFFDNIGE